MLLLTIPVAGITGSQLTDAQEIELAIAPYLSARTLISNFQPLRAYLEEQLHTPIIVVTAPDYRVFQERIRKHAYPVIITVAHSAWLAHIESGYIPLLQPVVKTRPVLVVRKTSPIRTIDALRHHEIALPDPLAIITMQALPLLRAAGLDPSRDIRLRHMPTHSAAVNLVLNGEAAAAIISDRALQQMPAPTQNRLRRLDPWTAEAFPGVVYMARPDLPNDQVAKLTRAILNFSRDTPQGRRLMTLWGYERLVPVTEKDLAPVAAYGKQLQGALIALPDAAR